MLKLCSFMLKYANYAKIMPIMLYAPAMLLCQFLCWHNPLTPSGSEWAGGETDSDDDFYFPNGGSGGGDCDVCDYL